MSTKFGFWYTVIQKFCLFCLKSIALGAPSTLLSQIYKPVDRDSGVNYLPWQKGYWLTKRQNPRNFCD
jgi:hypothetical protein